MEPSSDRLAVTLTLFAGNKTHVIPAGNIQSFDLELHSYGGEGGVEFLLPDNKSQGGKQKDNLITDFVKPDLMEAALSIKTVLGDTQKKITPTALLVRGIVTEKSVTELSATGMRKLPIIERRYRLRFVDSARVLWRQHFPCELYTEKSFQDVLEAHKGEKIKLSYDWQTVLGKVEPLLFLGLVPEQGASFYDLVLWYVERNRGVFSYDYTQHGYVFSGAKNTKGKALELQESDVKTMEVHFPPPPRHSAKVHNALAENAKTEEVKNPQAVAGIHEASLLRTPIADNVKARVELYKARLKPRGLELRLTWLRMPTEALAPGALVKLPPTNGWNPASVAGKETFRVRHLTMSGRAPETLSDAERDALDAAFHFEMSTWLEGAEETWCELPEYEAPQYPRHVEGVLVSELGEEKEETWQAYSDKATSVDCYHVKIPLWADQVVSAPFGPNLLPGHFYFPAYKGERVLVALDFQQAQIKRFLDWRAGARLPQEAQGVQLLMGKTASSGAFIKHSYEEEKPVLHLQRANDKDTGTIRIKEGQLLIQIKEESKS